MTVLPHSSKLSVEHLAASFNNVTNSYKFYWFLAILEHIRENQSPIISLDALLARMVADVWYPTNYFRLSFGKQDRLGQIAVRVGGQAGLPMDAGKCEVIQVVTDYLAEGTSLARDITSLGQYVPFRFLRPFFTPHLRGLQDWKVNAAIAERAEQTFADPDNPCLYRFVSEPTIGIEIQPDWFEYLNRHLPILSGFCLWHLVNYAQKNNPNVPNVSNKLFEPEQRDLKQARAFWNLAFDRLGALSCIYSGQMMQKGNFSLDHFLPWRFVAHDLLWNIIPTPKIVNSAKSDNLPDLTRHFDSFARLQYEALQAVAAPQRARLLEDYTLLLRAGSVAEIPSLSFDVFWTVLHDAIAPQMQIAVNMGFNPQWSYTTRC
jgi:hypothetical protein